MFITLETERLFVEPLKMEDNNFILELLNSKGWLKYIGDRNVKNEEDASKYIQKTLDNANYFCSILKLKSTRQPIGILTFIIRENQKYPDLGFAMLPTFEKKGYAFEASSRYLVEIIKSRKFDKILGITMAENENSIKLLEKLGLKFQEKRVEENEEISIYGMPLI